ncbi:hypothetical protein CYYG_00039 [Cyanophage SS120-1]|uniref:Uncharacterized protein n=1 Tax=Cyanophage SS120-1 TaxID=616674 RepID=M1T369_9CAUD|nr:hypothetical protein CYYG_00039 [Cyanophage SS120-1]AGG54540.1 hypothetical protein CYYG_00039 [Cyanophage SS120-1]
MASTSKQEKPAQTQKLKTKPKRSRQDNGRYKTESTEIESGLEKEIDYSVKKRVDAPTEAAESAGKYSRKEKVTPSFGTVKTILH